MLVSLMFVVWEAGDESETVRSNNDVAGANAQSEQYGKWMDSRKRWMMVCTHSISACRAS